MIALEIAPAKNGPTTSANGLAASSDPWVSVMARLVVVPVMCETTRAQNSKAIALVYPPIHDREMARRDF
jgi:hypothetical protein